MTSQEISFGTAGFRQGFELRTTPPLRSTHITAFCVLHRAISM